jgi:hypothetical protein
MVKFQQDRFMVFGNPFDWYFPRHNSNYAAACSRSANLNRVKDWEIIADNLGKAEWSWRCVSAVDREGRTIWIADAHRDHGKRFVVHADEILRRDSALL